VAVAELVAADIAVRRLRTRDARQALDRAHLAALASRIPSLVGEVDQARQNLDAPAARLVVGGTERLLRLEEVEAVLGSGELVVDACRREVRAGRTAVSLVTRPVLFALAVVLAERAPAEVNRAELIWQAFTARRANDSHRARLRVEIGRLRKALTKLADVSAAPNGFVLLPRRKGRALLLLPPVAGEASALVALLGGGEAWSTSGLAAALGKSQRARGKRQGSVRRPRPRSALGSAAEHRFRDNVVTGRAGHAGLALGLWPNEKRSPPQALQKSFASTGPSRTRTTFTA
jgi:hypothetical protein